MQPAPTISYVQKSDHFLKRHAVNLIELATGRRRLTQIYNELRKEPFETSRFFTRAIELGELKLIYNRYDEQAIPRQGPLVFIANHPFGIVDGLILCDIAARTRGDFRILLNNRLCKDENLNKLFLPVSFDGTREATRMNVATKRAAEELLKNNGTLIIFPAGGVATRWQFGMAALADLPWTTFAAKLIRKTRATVVPICFEGENSPLFHFASSISESLRLSLFIHEVTRQVGTPVHFTLGKPIPYDEIAHIEGRKALTEHLKARVEAMAATPSAPRLPRLQKFSRTANNHF